MNSLYSISAKYNIMRIESSVDWRVIESELTIQMRSMYYNRDLYKMKDNINNMVTELSKSEVDARRMNKMSHLQSKIDDINIAISNLEKWILMLILSQ